MGLTCVGMFAQMVTVINQGADFQGLCIGM